MYPDMYPRFTCDPGAIKFILKGANVMCKGLTNEFGSMDDVEEGAIVSIYVKDIENAVVRIF
jgi:PUA domain protein